MNEMILEYEGLVYSLAKKFYGANFEDLVQAGFLGLVKAYKNFKPEMNAKFSTYAYNYIYGEMYEAANGEKPIKLQKDALRLYKSVTKTRELLTQKFGRDVSIEETVKYLKLDINTFRDILNSLNVNISIENTELNLTRADYTEDMMLLKESLMNLSDVERRVIENRYIGDLSQDETAKILGLTQVNVSRIEKRGKEKIKEFIAL